MPQGPLSPRASALTSGGNSRVNEPMSDEQVRLVVVRRRWLQGAVRGRRLLRSGGRHSGHPYATASTHAQPAASIQVHGRLAATRMIATTTASATAATSATTGRS